MECIKVFIASSAELQEERMELVDLLQDLNAETKKNGVYFKPVLWEYMDSSMRQGRKEDEYLVRLRECKICITIFWLNLGKYTKEELDVAKNEKEMGKLPESIHVLFKTPDEKESENLRQFKEKFNEEYKGVPSYKFETSKELRNLVTEILIEYCSSPTTAY